VEIWGEKERLSKNLTPCMHPEKSKIFLGTRFIPLSFEGEGEQLIPKGILPHKIKDFVGTPVFKPLRATLLDSLLCLYISGKRRDCFASLAMTALICPLSLDGRGIG